MSLKNLAANKTTDIKGEQDRLAGSAVPETDAYPGTITLAYSTKASSGALGVVIHFKTDDGRNMSSTQYITSGTKKGGMPYYEKDGVKTFLPGYLLIDSLCQLTCGKSVTDMDEEEKTFNIWNGEQKKEVPTKVQAIVELFGKKAVFGMVKTISNKHVNGNDTNEKRESAELDKVFQHETGLTVVELQAKETTAQFLPKWLEANKGKTRDKFKQIAGVAVPPVSGGAAPTTGLFADA